MSAGSARATALVRTKKKHDLAIDLGGYIITSPRITKVWVGEDSLEAGWKKFSVLTTWVPHHREVTVFVLQYIIKQTEKERSEFE